MKQIALSKPTDPLPDAKMVSIVNAMSEKFFFSGRTLHAAAAHLTINDLKQCLQTLVRTNALYLAALVSKHLYPQALPEVAKLLSYRAERFY